jgi:hypothetical protein
MTSGSVQGGAIRRTLRIPTRLEVPDALHRSLTIEPPEIPLMG